MAWRDRLFVALLFLGVTSGVYVAACSWNPDPCNTITYPEQPYCILTPFSVICTSGTDGQGNCAPGEGWCEVQWTFAVGVASGSTSKFIFSDNCGGRVEGVVGPWTWTYSSPTCKINCNEAPHHYGMDLIAQCDSQPLGIESGTIVKAKGTCVCP